MHEKQEVGGGKMEEQLVKLLAEKNLIISTAESCTGGLIAGTIVNVAGASSVFNEGFITYSNEAKEKRLGVGHDTLEKYGAVSGETVREMAEGLAKVTGADVTIVSSGIAGPDGGTIEKPVGLVYLCCFVKGKTYVRKNIIAGDRQQVREQAVKEAIELAIDSINK